MEDIVLAFRNALLYRVQLYNDPALTMATATSPGFQRVLDVLDPDMLCCVPTLEDAYHELNVGIDLITRLALLNKRG